MSSGSSPPPAPTTTAPPTRPSPSSAPTTPSALVSLRCRLSRSYPQAYPFHKSRFADRVRFERVELDFDLMSLLLGPRPEGFSFIQFQPHELVADLAVVLRKRLLT